MTWYTKIVVTDATAGGSVIITDSEKSINASRGISNKTGRFDFMVPNSQGQYSGTFAVGDKVEFYLDDSANPGTKIFTGIINSLNFNSNSANQRETLTVGGNDYAQKLIDVSAVNVYDDLPAGSIVKALLNEYVSGITTNNVQDGPIIDHIGFNRRPIFDCCKQLAVIADYQFYVDADNDLHFESEAAAASNETLYSGNSYITRFTRDRGDMYNSIYVYGGRRTVRFEDSWIADGGSVFTMTYKPISPYVIASGIKQVGWIKELSALAPAGTDYLHDYDNKQLIFVSGTQEGANIPASGVAINAQYGRKVPVVKYASSRESIAAYGKKEKRVVNEEIQDPREATALAKALVAKYKNPVTMGEVHVEGLNNLTPGHTIDVDFPFDGVNNETHIISEVNYNLTPVTLQNGRFVNMRTNRNPNTLTDAMQDIIDRLTNLEASRVDESDIITRLDLFTGSYTTSVDEWSVKRRTVGSSFILNSPVYGPLGTVTGTQPYLGDSRGAWIYMVSGTS